MFLIKLDLAAISYTECVRERERVSAYYTSLTDDDFVLFIDPLIHFYAFPPPSPPKKYSLPHQACEAPQRNSHYKCDENGDLKCLAGSV